MAAASRSTASITAATSRAPGGAGGGACVTGEAAEDVEVTTGDGPSGGGDGIGSGDFPAAVAGSISFSGWVFCFAERKWGERRGRCPGALWMTCTDTTCGALEADVDFDYL